MTTQVVILGTGGNCIDILDTLNDINREEEHEVYRCIGFLDDDHTKWGKCVHGIEVKGPLSSAIEYRQCRFINGIGSERNFWRKEEIIRKAGLEPEEFENIIHPTAYVSALSTLGNGVVVLQNTTIASSVSIGDHVIVLPNSVLSHDSQVGAYSCIAGGVCMSGNVSVGKACYLGTNSAIKNDVKIDDFSLVGMGSVVINDVRGKTVVIGNPARFLRHLDTGVKYR